ncbi:MAG: MFS transporter [Dysosmobacter sp.]
MPKSRERAVRLFILVLICVAITSGLGNRILSNYFKEVYQVTSAQRGFIEIPRESPGILCMVLVAGLGFLGNIRLGILAQIMMLAGLMVMGFLSPGYGVMLIFLFLYSLGEHLFMPLSDSISMDLARDGKVGTALGKFKGVTTMASMVASCAVFVGFRAGFFSFQSRVILPFAIGVAASALAAFFLWRLEGCMTTAPCKVTNHKLLFRREYVPYYMVTLAYGCQKRIRLVFAPWVIIELLHRGADVAALLTIVVHLVGMVVAPILGRMLDRLGMRRMLLIEAAYIVVTFCVLGVLAGQLAAGTFGAGWQAWVVYGAYVLCLLFDQFNMVHAFLMRSIALSPDEVTRSLSVGLGVDHIMAIVASPIMGLIWEGAGVQYVFYLAALSALFQVAAAAMVKRRGLEPARK